MNTQTLPRIDDLRRELKAIDRCDVCGAKAWVRAVLGGSELLFCGHHANKHIDALQNVATFIQDERDQLLTEEN